MIESQVRYIMDAITKLDKRGDAWLDVKQDVQDRYNDKLQEELKDTVWQNGGCMSWYQQADGRNTCPVAPCHFPVYGAYLDGEHERLSLAAGGRACRVSKRRGCWLTKSVSSGEKRVSTGKTRK